MKLTSPFTKKMRVGIATTVANADESIAQFINYHLAIGFTDIYIFIDDNSKKTYEIASNYPQVQCFLRTTELIELWKKTPAYNHPKKQELITIEVMVRQEMNFYIAFNKAQSDGVDWLLHIDLDELFFPNEEDVIKHFSTLQRNGITCISYLNYESIISNIDNTETMYYSVYFKKNFFRHKHWIFSKAQRDFLKNTPWLKPKFFNYYQNGKSAVNTHFNPVQICDVHSIITPGQRKFGGNNDPIILHFPCSRKSDFIKKYKILGYFPDQWMGFDRAGNYIDRIHLDARDLFLNGTDEEIEEFYKKHFVMGNAQIETLIKEDMAIKIDYHIEKLNAHNTANKY